MHVTLEQAIASCLAGDAGAFGVIYDAYIRKIYNFVYYKTQHKETAEDVTSQVFIKALNGIAHYNPTKGSIQTWLYAIAKNAVTDHFRTVRETGDIADVWDLRDTTDIARDAENREQLAHIQKGLSALSVEQRDVVMLRVWEQLSYAEIAEITGKSEASCKMTFKRSIDALRHTLPLTALLLLLTRFYE